jgi:formylglycine-generating enzyme required for sulfatase activity
VKAGLLPQLSEEVLPVYLEATANETETRLLNGLRKRCPGLPVHLSVKESMAALRRGQGIPAGKKVLIVLDQFEQWLHAEIADHSELVQALRQCDGEHVQCIVMVRDDFWLAVSRLVCDLEVDLVPGHNIALVDLFDLDHARKVLAAFGRAFGKLPENAPTKEHQDFLNQAVSGLAQEGRVICVRLALFAEMMKGKSWTPAMLKQVGGTEGVGVTFLEDSFSSPTANPKHRLHQKEARAVLKILLPEPSMDIKGHMPSEAELRTASGSLGEFSEQALPPVARQALLSKVQDIYRTDVDPGLHGAAEWLLRAWQQEAWLKQVNDGWTRDNEQRLKRLESIRQFVTKDKEKTPRWYVNGQGQTMEAIPGPVEFLAGSPTTEEARQPEESQHKQRIARTFAIAATSVTEEQYIRFLPIRGNRGTKLPPDPTTPIAAMPWYEAAAYCNWLSKQEGIAEAQWCYETNGDGQVAKLKANHLSLTGYRLPTEAEWEYACRAGAMTSRYYGETEDLLTKYAWYFKNSEGRRWPVANKKPNDWGLFDMQGNVWNWCQDRFKPYRQEDAAVDDKEEVLTINSEEPRVVRGGSFVNAPSHVRSAFRGYQPPTDRFMSIGFRPARTIAP